MFPIILAGLILLLLAVGQRQALAHRRRRIRDRAARLGLDLEQSHIQIGPFSEDNRFG